MVDKFTEVDLHPDKVSNHEMGYVFEELIRRFNEQANETAGEHFTPREVIRLMVNLIFAESQADLKKKGIIRTLYDPACGTGGMLTIGKEYILKHINPNAEIISFGQELNPQSYAIAKSDALIMGENADNIQLGNSFTDDKFVGKKFYYMLSNPPFGVSWKKEQEFIENEATNPHGRFFAGTPRVNDGALMFLQHMISKMEPTGSRIAIVFNGSPLFTGDAGSGESNIRKWIIEGDMLEAIIGMPDQLFYNTGISTYLWIVTNKKSAKRKGKVQLINAVGSNFFEKMRKSLGNKRNYITEKQIQEIIDVYTKYEEGDYCKIFNNEDFGYTKVTIERPLRLSLNITQENFYALVTYFVNSSRTAPVKNLIYSIGDDYTAKTTLRILQKLIGKEFISVSSLVNKFKEELSGEGKYKSFDKSLERSIEFVCNDLFTKFGVTNPQVDIILDSKGNPKPDSNLRDTESIPLTEDVEEYFKREVLPHVPDAWMDRSKDKIGYEISFTKYFYKYQPLRPLKDITADILALEQETEGLLKQIIE